MFNILTDPLIRINVAGSTYPASLPATYTALIDDKVDAFPALRPHQHHAWHAFLVQLGAMAMHRDGLADPPNDAAEWLRVIRALTPSCPNDEPWQLVVEDLTKPAFMQPPASSAEREKDYKSTVATPDELDMLVTSKNHDLKTAVAAQADPDEWLFALVTLQTMEGFSGAGNYGISRMNGGLGSRPAFTLTPSARLGAHIRRDITTLLEYRSTLMDEYQMSDHGVDLLWTLSWDGTPAETLLLDRLDPFYIEVCRRIRLRSNANRVLHGVRTSTKAARIAGKELKGRTGDPWVPVNTKRDGLPLTLAGGGFTYKRVTDYLTSEDWQWPCLLRPLPEERHSAKPMYLVARGMVRGQGKTEGYHERIIPLRPKTVGSAMIRQSAVDELGTIARERIEQVSTIQRILSHAIQVFAARGDNGKVSPEHRALARPWLNELDEIVDTNFFEGLQNEFEAGGAERQTVRNTWLMNGTDGVIDHARRTLHTAEDSLPCPAIHRYRARVNAEGLFEGRIRGAKGLPFLFDTHEGGAE
jgi:CRISPR system Cascade subunit CasA